MINFADEPLKDWARRRTEDRVYDAQADALRKAIPQTPPVEPPVDSMALSAWLHELANLIETAAVPTLSIDELADLIAQNFTLGDVDPRAFAAAVYSLLQG